jgi:hypothetical protein
VISYSRQLVQAYVLESYRMPGLSTIEAGTEIERIYERFPPFSHTVVDSGGQGAAFVKQWKTTHPNIPARPVKKGMDSVDMGIAIINADIRAGKIFFVVKGCEDLLQELDTLQWDEKAEKIGRRTVKRGMQDHAMDSFRYACTKLSIHDIKGFQIDTTPRNANEAAEQSVAALRAEELGREHGNEPYWVKVGKTRRSRR